MVNAGPLVWDRPFTVHCTLQVGSHLHGDTTNDTLVEQAGSITPDGTTHVAVMEPRPIEYTSPVSTTDYLCTSVSSPSGTIYWHAGDELSDVPVMGDPPPGHWSTDPDTLCTYYRYIQGPLPVNKTIEYAGARSCAEVMALHPWFDPGHDGPRPEDRFYVDHEGDVFLDDGGGLTEARWRETMVWDCPGYADYAQVPWQPGADGIPVIDF